LVCIFRAAFASSSSSFGVDCEEASLRNKFTKSSSSSSHLAVGKRERERNVSPEESSVHKEQRRRSESPKTRSESEKK
jgi:hypothetical protein